VGRTTGFSQGFVDKFDTKITVGGGLELKEVVTAKDGTRKMVFKLTEGSAQGVLHCGFLNYDRRKHCRLLVFTATGRGGGLI
jgi:uncharacterized protein YodC (DUF2158 family)